MFYMQDLKNSKFFMQTECVCVCVWEREIEQTSFWLVSRNNPVSTNDQKINLHQLDEKYNKTNFPFNVAGSTGSPFLVSRSEDDKKYSDDILVLTVLESKLPNKWYIQYFK